MAKFPIYLEMAGRRAVVIGAGPVAVRKVQALHETGARITVVAPQVSPSLERAFLLSHVELVLTPYRKDYLVDATLVIAATNDADLNKQIYHDCQELEILCNVVDVPELCDFYTPAIVKRGDLQIAIGTDGNYPAYAGHLRRKLEDVFTQVHGEFLKELEEMRAKVLKSIPNADERKAVLGRLASDESFDIFNEQGQANWKEYAHAQMASSQSKY